MSPILVEKEKEKESKEKRNERTDWKASKRKRQTKSEAATTSLFIIESHFYKASHRDYKYNYIELLFKYINMQLAVKTLKGEKFEVTVEESHTIAQVKTIIVSY